MKIGDRVRYISDNLGDDFFCKEGTITEYDLRRPLSVGIAFDAYSGSYTCFKSSLEVIKCIDAIK